jgi:hypothetical protein
MMETYNPLNRHPRVREAALATQWVVTGVQTVLSALFAFMYGSPAEWPVVFLGSLAVTPVLWAYLGLTAQGNVTGMDPQGYKLPGVK